MATAKTKSEKTVKKTVKPVAKAVKKAVVTTSAKETTKKAAETVAASEVRGLVATVFGVDGAAKGKLTLAKDVFGEKVNKQLMAQAVRVYLANQREGGANTKTRGEVEGSTRKIYRQKGTGRARHGSIRAHIFVGGGIAFGPQTHDFSMTMPEKMKRKALSSALSSQYKEGNVIVMDGLETLKPKTKEMVKALGSVEASSCLLVLAENPAGVVRAARNIEGVTLQPARNLTTYDVLAHKKIVFMKQAVSVVEKNITQK